MGSGTGRRRRAAAGVLSVTALLGVLALATEASWAEHGELTETRVAEHLSLFDTEQEASDRVPATAEAAVRQLGEPTDARLLSESEHARFYAFPSSDGAICLLGVVSVRNLLHEERKWSHAVTCASQDAFSNRGAYIHLGADDEQHGVLAVPDGSEVLVASAASGAEHALALRRNSVTFGPFALEEVEGTEPHGRLAVVQAGERVELVLPRAAVDTLQPGP